MCSSDLMSKLKVTPEETIYIGDTFGDIIAAKNAGWKSIPCTTIDISKEDIFYQLS